jgi:cell division protein ZapA (FtsZ GTPase activity inhibitor)
MKEEAPKSKKISVSIGGVSYQLVSHENEEYMRSIALKADDIISRIANGNPSLSGMQVNVLAIINLLDALTHRAEESETLKSRFDEWAAREEAREKELFAVRETNFELRKEMNRITELNRQLMLEIASLIGDRATPADVPSPVDRGPSRTERPDSKASWIRSGWDMSDSETGVGTFPDQSVSEDEHVEAAEFAVIDDSAEPDEMGVGTFPDQNVSEDEHVEAAEFAVIDDSADQDEDDDVADGDPDASTHDFPPPNEQDAPLESETQEFHGRKQTSLDEFFPSQDRY